MTGGNYPDWRDAWLAQRPPDVGVDLDHESAPVRRTIESLRQDWSNLRPRAASAEAFAQRALQRRSSRRLPHTIRIAALLLAAAALGITLARVGLPTLTQPSAPATDPGQPRVLVATRDRVEMRAGPVHLVLVRPVAAETNQPPNEEIPR